MVELSPVAHRVQLISGFIAACTILAYLTISPGIEERRLTTLEKIQKRGYLEVLTLNGATTFYQDSEGANGFEYQLATWFAQSIGVEARFIVVPGYADIYPELMFGTGDIAAAGLSGNDSRYSDALDYGPAYHEVAKQVLYRKGGKRPREPGDLVGGRIKVISGTAHVQQLRDLRVPYPDITWIEVDDIASAELIEQVDTGEAEYVLTDAHEISLQLRYFPLLRIAFDVGAPRKLRWAYNRSDDTSLGDAITTFFEDIERDGRLQQLLHRHYSQVETFNYSDIQTFTQRIETHLPQYRDLFEKEAAAVDMDWRLLASIAYQESLWNERARSPTGVRGLMMLTLNTAAQMGVENRLDPAQSVYGGAKYFTRILKKIPQRIPEPDRTWFALAAYNVGFGHLEDARKITQGMGGDPDRWIDVKKSLPLLARKKWYKSTKYGYARGWEPVIYVENIRQYYDYLVNFDNRSLPVEATPKPRPEAAPLAPSL